MRISSAFDGGNIEIVAADSCDNIRLRIRADHQSHYFQWFHYRLSGARGQACVMQIENAGQSAYVDGWTDYQAVASYDRQHWFRVPTEYADGVLRIQHQPEQDSAYYAYFAPYSMERHADLIARTLQAPGVELIPLGKTLDGQDMDLLQIGSPTEGKRRLWVFARQHPGETMAEWWMEGFLQRLTDPADALAQDLLRKAVFYVVPCMNPDGARRGHLRTNAAGTDLNRAWQNPSMETSPEVYLVREAMERFRPDFCLDVHGDEAIPANFIAGAEGIPRWSERHADLLKHYLDSLLQASPDFQTELGYPVDAPGQANLAIATNFLAEQFDCLSMTLEMPFKDHRDRPDPAQGWSPERCRQLGHDNLTAMAQVLPALR